LNLISNARLTVLQRDLLLRLGDLKKLNCTINDFGGRSRTAGLLQNPQNRFKKPNEFWAFGFHLPTMIREFNAYTKIDMFIEISSICGFRN